MRSAVPPIQRHARVTPKTGRARVAAGLAALLAAGVAALVGPATPSRADTPTSARAAAEGTDAADAATAAPDLAKGVAYLIYPANLVDGHFYAPFGGGFADWGLTLDGTFALAAAGSAGGGPPDPADAGNQALAGLVAYIDSRGVDGTGLSIDDWSGIGTQFATGGSIGKEALLAEVVGRDPRDFGGHDLIEALDASVCTAATAPPDFSCVAAGDYLFTASVFSQSLGVMAALRAGDTTGAQAPLAYLESLQHSDGSFPSLIPDTGDRDVDSTAMAVMTLALLPDQSDAVDKGVAWIAGQQEADGGFPGAAGDSVNSAGLAIQALTLHKDTYQTQIDAADAFLAAQQNTDGGFNPAAGVAGSDLRASAQAVGGVIGTSFGTLAIDLSGVPTPSPSPSNSPSSSPSHSPSPTHTVTHTPSPTHTTHPATHTTHPTTHHTTHAAAPPPPVPTQTTPTTTAPAATPTLSLPPLTPPSAAASPSRTVAITDVAADKTAINPLWWVVLAVALVLAAVVILLFWWRGRGGGPKARHAR